MAKNNVSAGVFTDFATGDNYSAFQLQMELVIPYESVDHYLALLDQERWGEITELLVARYPEYKEIIEVWIAATKHRKEKEKAVENISAAKFDVKQDYRARH